MARPTTAWRKISAQPGRFALQVLKAFQKNQYLEKVGPWMIAPFGRLTQFCLRRIWEPGSLGTTSMAWG
jgi:hypothetical protein